MMGGVAMARVMNRVRIESSTAAVLGLVAFVGTGLGCSLNLGKLGESPDGDDSDTGETDAGDTDAPGDSATQGGQGESSGGSGGTGSDDPEESRADLYRYGTGKLDILVVVDNSGSMAGPQEALAEGVRTFLPAIFGEDHQLDYRLAVTTTDMANPWCSEEDNGRFIAQSCREHLDDFIYAPGFPNEQDDRATCERQCPLDSLGLQPSSADGDSPARVRPWLEQSASGSNIPPGVEAADVAACMLMQGVSGCGLESPLEAVASAIRRAQDPADPAHGFLRTDAQLAIIILTDEADCSTADTSIFSADGDRAFWSDPEGSNPTSAVCWNAGTLCTGKVEGTYETCVPADRGPLGEAGAPEDEAVLVPVENYHRILADALTDHEPSVREPEVVVVAGVPPGYGRWEQEVVYSETEDETWMHDYGIGPGCEGPTSTALPPVRLKAFVEAYPREERNLFSICQDGAGADALQRIADRVIGGSGSPCVPFCVADTNPSAPRTQAACSVSQVFDADGSSRAVAPCDSDPATGEVVFAPGQDVCHRVLADRDLPPACDEQNSNVAVRVHWAPGVTPEPSRIRAECESANPSACE